MDLNITLNVLKLVKTIKSSYLIFKTLILIRLEVLRQ